ncbi:MAG: phospho-N-acetylmuramoyl-pentapeptide-transferase [Tumebacillaceae bacterium]
MLNTISSAGVAFLLTAILTPLLIKFLLRFNLTQPIRKELPADHQAKKGTPLMAGLILLLSLPISLAYENASMTYFLSITFLLFGFIGFLDDFKKAAFQDPRGVSGKFKLVLQFLFTGGLLYILFTQFGLTTEVPITRTISLDLNIGVFITLALLFIVGSANAINFTDGLDGLLINVAIPTYLFFFLITDSRTVEIFSLAMIGCLVGLLLYNKYPARAFMGDTGSLAIGGSLCFLAVIEKVEILVPLLFIVYLAEQFSVIIQVYYFKATGRRLFRMSPIHYHYSLKYGWSEKKIVRVFGLTSWVFACLAYLYWHLFL